MRPTLSLLIVLATAASSLAQSSWRPHGDFGFAVGSMAPSIVLDQPGGLRTRPIATETGETYKVITRELVGDVGWTPSTRTIVGILLSAQAIREFDYAKPAVAPPLPFRSYVSSTTSTYRQHSVNIAQVWDAKGSRVAPFVGGGIEFRSPSRTQRNIGLNYADSSPAYDSATTHDGSQTSFFAIAGLRAFMGRHAMAFADTLIYVETLERDDPGLTLDASTGSVYGAIPWRLRVGAGLHF